jgi:SAM-dependent methyltransferase
MGLLTRNTDHDWERLGAENPYYAVVTHDEYDRSRLDDRARAKFFDGGRTHVDHVFRVIRQHIAADFAPQCALDFGCGVGRVLISLASMCQQVVGIDVSQAMLSEAEANIRTNRLDNVKLIQIAGDQLPDDLTFDFIHSFIVFQHIPVRRGERLFRQLVMRLRPGGVGSLHFTYDGERSGRAFFAWLRGHVPLVHRATNALRGNRAFPAPMQMNHYNMNRLFSSLHDHDVGPLFIEQTRHGATRGMMMYFRRAHA